MTFGVVMLSVPSLGCDGQSRKQSDSELGDHVACSFKSDGDFLGRLDRVHQWIDEVFGQGTSGGGGLFLGLGLVWRSEYHLFPLVEFNDVETSRNWCWMVLSWNGTSED